MNIKGLTWAGTLIVISLGVVGTLVGGLARFAAVLEPAANFCLQYLFSLGGGALMAGALKHPKAAAVASVFACINLARVLPFYGGSPAPDSNPRKRVYKALLFNVLYDNTAYDKLIELVGSANPDVIMLLEITPEWQVALLRLQVDYPFCKIVARSDPGGIAFMSRIPVEAVDVLHFGVQDRPALAARMNLDGESLLVVGLHPYASRRDRAKTEARRKQVDRLARWVREQETAIMVLADMNFTPWSPLYTDLLRESCLRDGRQGFGVKTSWPSYCLLLSMPIDHCLVSPEITVCQYQMRRVPGSDHLAAVIDFTISAPGDLSLRSG